jgi:hypothetical protein
MTSPSFVQRLFFIALASDLRVGKMRTRINGTVVTEAEARRLVDHARACGWIPLPTDADERCQRWLHAR